MGNDDFDTLDGLPTIRGDDGDETKLLADRYKIIRKLGEGGMGLVYLAEDTELDSNKVAIKFIPPMLAGNVRAIKNLKKEAQTAMQLSHPNIVRLHDLHTDGHQKFLAMEYIEGKTLEELLAEKEDDRFTLEELLPIAEQVAAGLDYAHSRKVLHRDLKPSNIMVTRDGRAKLLDFGIAREIKDSYTRVTGQETSGTLPYMSPQQLMGEPPDPSMDIYSLGAVFYECLAGHPPFYMGDIREQIKTREPDALKDAPSHCSSILLTILSKKAADRPKHALECVQKLRVKDGKDTKQQAPRERPRAPEAKTESTKQEPVERAPRRQEVPAAAAKPSRSESARRFPVVLVLPFVLIPLIYAVLLKTLVDSRFSIVPITVLAILFLLTLIGPARLKSPVAVLVLPSITICTV